VQSLAAAGVTTTTVGLGLDFNEDLMTSMAQSGQGSSLYGERLEDLEEAFDSELSLMKAIAFRKVRLVIDDDQAHGIEVVNGYARDDDAYQLPSIACGSEAWALLRMPMA
jgi:Ca-activated chloride channel family protein